MSAIDDIAERLRSLDAAERAQLVAALLAPLPPRPDTEPGLEPVPSAVPVDDPSAMPKPEQVSGTVALQAGPPITPDTPNEIEDSVEQRARLLSLLLANPSGLSGYVLLDQYHIPPSSIELAIRDGQATSKAERGIGLTHEYGGPWAREDVVADEARRQEEMRRNQEMFAQRLRGGHG